MHAFTDPIIAVSTAPGRGAIGIVRISGKDLRAFAQKLVSKSLAPRQAQFLRLKDASQDLIDEVLALYFQGPQSYTGEDVLELQGHGGQQVLQRMIKRCFEVSRETSLNGASTPEAANQPLLPHLRLAKPGEFTQRAYLNNKIDLLKAESIIDLIDASTELAAISASRSLSGAFSREVERLLDQVTKARVIVEAQIDFPEEEIEELRVREQDKTKQDIEAIIEQAQKILAKARQGVLLKEGLKTVIAGQPNVGKSSLMNQLCEQEVSIVTNIAGTTRDLVQQSLQIEGIPIHLIDTAGINSKANSQRDVVEKIGIERAWKEMNQAQLILFVHDLGQLKDKDYQIAEKHLNQQIQQHISDNALVVHVWNKIDLYDNDSTLNEINDLIQSWETKPNAPVLISTQTGAGLNLLKSSILHQLGCDLNLGEDVYIARQRHLLSLNEMVSHLSRAHEIACTRQMSVDLIAEELRLSQNALSQVTGEFSSDDLLGEIFSNFCIGK